MINWLKSPNVQQRQWAGRLFDCRNDFWVCGLDFWLLRVFYVEVIIPLNYSNLWVYLIKFWIIIKKCYCQSCKQDLKCMFKITNKEKTKFLTGMTRTPFHTIVKGGHSFCQVCALEKSAFSPCKDSLWMKQLVSYVRNFNQHVGTPHN